MSEERSWVAAGALGIVRTVLSLLLWTLWLALALLLVVQIYVASTSELHVPGVLMKRLEEQLAESGLRAAFGGSSIDPNGIVLLENARFSLPDFPEPVLTARAVYVRLNPWMLTVGRIEPREIRVMGAALFIPAMLARSGTAEELVHHADATLHLRGRELIVEQFTTRAGAATVMVRGTIPLPRRRGESDPRQLANFLQHRFPGLCRQASVAARELERFQEPLLDVELAVSDSGSPLVSVNFRARRMQAEQPVPFELEYPEASTRLLLLEGPAVSRIDLSARELQVPSQATAQRLRAVVFGRLNPGDGPAFDIRSIEATADSLAAAGFDARNLSLVLLPKPLPLAEATVALEVMGEPLAVQAETDLRQKTARLNIRGRIAPAILGPLSERLRVDVRRYFDFGALDCATGEVRLGPGWKFQHATAQVALQDINAYGVKMESGHATVQFDGRRFYSPAAFARIGPNFAHGSYEQDLQTRAFRFLLHGRLRPMDISTWFRDWWSNFFAQMEFPAAPPSASVDVRGIWKSGHETSVFVFADAAQPVARGVPLDRVRTRLFIRPSYFDGLELLAQRGPGSAQGTFMVRTNPVSHDWSLFDLKMDSTFELPLLAELTKPLGPRLLAPFEAASAPELRVDGRFEGPGAAGGARHRVRIDARAEGILRFHHFPLYDVSFGAGVTEKEILLDRLEARFGGGVVTAHARISPLGERPRLGFDVNLKGSSLGQVATALEEFFAFNQSRAPGTPGKFVREKASVRLDLAASGEGEYANPYSYRGDGHAVLEGAEIGEVSLLGALSELFTFTALRFNSARANFKIQGASLVFPEIAIRGESSAIDAHGTYALDRRELDFNAKVFPFQESGNLIKSVVGAVLTPLSNALEVKLQGTLQKPEWSFVIGPTNFLRSLSAEARDEEKPAPADAAPAVAPPGRGPAEPAGPPPPAVIFPPPGTTPPPPPGANPSR